jgi:hypothetical protein
MMMVMMMMGHEYIWRIIWVSAGGGKGKERIMKRIKVCYIYTCEDRIMKPTTV